MAYGREGILLEGSSFRLNCELGEAYFWEGLVLEGLINGFLRYLTSVVTLYNIQSTDSKVGITLCGIVSDTTGN